MKIRILSCLFIMVFVVISFANFALCDSRRSFSFRNPSFGGHPGYGSHLMAVANAQNTYKEPEKTFQEKAMKALEAGAISAIRSKSRDAYLGGDQNSDSGESASGISTIQYDDYTVEIDASDSDNIKLSIY